MSPFCLPSVLKGSLHNTPESASPLYRVTLRPLSCNNYRKTNWDIQCVFYSRQNWSVLLPLNFGDLDSKIKNQNFVGLQGWLSILPSHTTLGWVVCLILCYPLVLEALLLRIRISIKSVKYSALVYLLTDISTEPVSLVKILGYFHDGIY